MHSEAAELHSLKFEKSNIQSITSNESAQELIKHKANDDLECSICRQMFDLKDRKPLVLPCGHSFCSDCLKKSAD